MDREAWMGFPEVVFGARVLPMFLPTAALGLGLLGIERILRGRIPPGPRAALLSWIPLRLVVPLGFVSSRFPGLFAHSFDVGKGLPSAPVEAGSNPLFVLAAWVWVLGALVLASWGLLRIARTRRSLWADSHTWEVRGLQGSECLAKIVGRRRKMRFRVTPHTVTPGITGLFRPVVWLPKAWLGQASTRDLELVLLHEVSHLERRDPWIGAFLGILAVLHWHHPVTWLGMSRWSTLREECCDDRVRRTPGVDSREYRAALCRFALGKPTGLRPSISMSRSGSSLITRLGGLERPASSHPLAPGLVILGLVGLVAAEPTVAVADPPAAQVEEIPWDPNPRGCLELRYATLRALAQTRARVGPPDALEHD